MMIKIRRAIESIYQRLINMIAKCVISEADDSRKVQTVSAEILKNERRRNIERFQEYGFTSNPPPETEGVMLSLMGSRTHKVVIATENRALRLKELNPGESAIYDKDGNYVWLKNNGEIEVKTSTRVLLSVPLVEMSGNCLIKGNLTVEGASNQQQAVTMGASLAVATTIVAGGNISSGANLADVTGTLAALRSAYNSHTHTGDFSGNTSTPNPPA